MEDKRLFLLDAMALVYRAYYALMNSPRVTSYGKNTNAQFGFTNYLVDLIKKEKPSHIAVVWDTHAPTERHEQFLDYKANREAAPEDFKEAIPDIKKIIEGFNIPSLEVDGYEADDIVGTLAWEASDLGYTVYMVTPDKDYGQLVRENVFIYKPGYKGGSFEIMGIKEVCEKWDISRVDQVIDILAMMGDAVDNIPGIKGVGEKTAAKLLKEYDNLEAVIANASNIKGALGEKIRNGIESAVMSKMLATIITDVPIAFHEESFLMADLNKEALQEIFTNLEFKTIAARVLDMQIAGVTPNNKRTAPTSAQTSLFDAPDNENEIAAETYFKSIQNTEHQYHWIQNKDDLHSLVKTLQTQKEICIDTETTSVAARAAKLVGISFSYQKHQGYYIPFNDDWSQTNEILAILKPLLEKEDVLWIGQNLKYDMIVLKNYGINIQAPYFDTMLAHFSMAPESKHGMDFMSRKYLQYEPVSITNLIGAKGKNQLNMKEVPIEQVKEYAVEDTDVTLQLQKIFKAKIETEGVHRLFYEVENPLVQVLADMEYEGVKIDVDFLKTYAASLEKELIDIERKIHEAVGHSFNIASPKQLGEVLFEELKLDEKAKKTKTGQYATGEEVLQKLKHKHEIVADILDYREMSKLKSTYADALPQLVLPKTGKVHSSFSQAVVVSGRLSSNNPNLQNIPIRTERGRAIRKAFIPSDEQHILLSSDYSQIELRVIAALSGDVNMIQDFIQEKDIHTATAARVYNIAESEVDSTMRRNAKSVNFGLIYGQSAFGLSQNLNISRTEAQEIISQYFKEYPQIKAYMDQIKQEAYEKGYVETIMGRKIRLADIQSSNATLRGFAERLAINAPIQGSAADMIKMAMIQIHKSFKAAQLKTKLILQVHDELIFDVAKDELEIVTQLVKEKMETALLLPNNVPVVAAWGTGKNWLDAH